MQTCAFKCSRNTLASINTLFVFIGLLLIGVAAYGKKESIIVYLPVLGGFIACGVFLILIAIFGLLGAIRHNQIILFFYMIIMSLLFILLLAFSIAALAVTKEQQHALTKKAWETTTTDQIEGIEKRFKCCGLDKVETRCAGISNDTTCYATLRQPLDKAVSVSGGVGLFFSFTLLLAVLFTVRYRNQKDPRMNADAFL